MRPVPDYMEPFVGVRMWNASNTFTRTSINHPLVGTFLCGMSYEMPWPPNKPMTANPVVAWDALGTPFIYAYGYWPTKCNGCGCYAYRTYWQYFWHSTYCLGRSTVIGECYLWGRMVEHQLGYRAEYAYPKRLIGTKKAVRQMAKLYGVPYISWPRFFMEKTYGAARRSPSRIRRGTIAFARAVASACRNTYAGARARLRARREA